MCEIHYRSREITLRLTVVWNAAVLGSDEIREAVVRLIAVLLSLLPEAMHLGLDHRPALILVDLNVVTHSSCRVEAKDAIQSDTLVVNEVLEHSLGLRKEFLGFSPDSGIIEDLWEATVGVSSSQLPHLKEGVPVNVIDNVRNVEVDDCLVAEHIWLDRLVDGQGPVHFESLCLSSSQRDVLAVLCIR